MATYCFLDQAPLTLACKGPNNPKAERCREWIRGLKAKGYFVLVPEIADYEARRAFLGSGNFDWLARLDAISAVALVPLTRPAILKAAEFWAELRKTGLGTSRDDSLDCDAILAAQAVTAVQPDDTVIVATGNPRHLDRFPGVTAQNWDYVS